MFQVEYQKQRQETIDKYRGFQTMNSNDHPIVQQGIKAAELRNVVKRITLFVYFFVSKTRKSLLACQHFTESVQGRLGFRKTICLFSGSYHSGIRSI